MTHQNIGPVLFIVGYDPGDHGWLQQSTWYRVFGPGQAMTLAGISVNYAYATEIARITNLLKAGLARWCILHRVSWSREFYILLELAKKYDCKITWDLDDNTIDPRITESAVHLNSATSGYKKRLQTHIAQQLRLLRLCDNAFFSTPELTEIASAHLRSSCTMWNYIPDFYDLQEDTLLESSWLPVIKDKFVIFYGPGSIDHMIHFDLIANTLSSFLMDHTNVTLLLGGGLPVPKIFLKFGEQIQRLPKVLPQTYFQLLKHVTVAVAPLKLDHFSSCKSWIKVLEPAYHGTVWLGSDSPNYRRFHEITGTGVLVRDQDWGLALQDVYSKISYYKKIARSACIHIKNEFSWSKKLSEYLQKRPN